jgi:hypothetical protein
VVLGPGGSADCSHGWNGGKVKHADAEPVDRVLSFIYRPKGRRSFDSSAPLGQDRDNTTSPTGCASLHPWLQAAAPMGPKNGAGRLVSIRDTQVMCRATTTVTKGTTAMKKAKGGSKGGKRGDACDWRGEMLARIRKLIQQADPEVVEEIKWRKPSNPAGVPVWSHGGIICTGETYKNVVKMTFAKGASLDDPSGLFNSSLDGNTRRAIDFKEGDRIDEKGLMALIKAAVALNTGGQKKSVRATPRSVHSQKKPKSG